MDFTSVLQNFGLAVALLFITGVAVWRVAVWFGVNIVQPVAHRHIKFLDDLTAGMASQSQALQTMSVQQGKNLDGMQQILAHLGDMMHKQDELIRHVTTLTMNRSYSEPEGEQPPSSKQPSSGEQRIQVGKRP